MSLEIHCPLSAWNEHHSLLNERLVKICPENEHPLSESVASVPEVGRDHNEEVANDTKSKVTNCTMRPRSTSRSCCACCLRTESQCRCHDHVEQYRGVPRCFHLQPEQNRARNVLSVRPSRKLCRSWRTRRCSNHTPTTSNC